MKTNRLITLAATAAMLAACSNNELPNIENKAEVAAVFTTNIDQRVKVAKTRVTDNAWDKDDVIGIFSLNPEFPEKTGAEANKAENLAYQYTIGEEGSNGKWNIIPTGTMKTFRFKNFENVTVKFKAYYPHNATITATEGGDLASATIPVDVSTQTKDNKKKNDFLFADNDGTKAADGTPNPSSGSRNSPNVKFQFTHSMAKVTLLFKPSDNVTFDDIKSMNFTLKGLKAKGKFSLVDGKVTSEGEAVDLALKDSTQVLPKDGAEDIMEKNGYITFTAIVPPQNMGASGAATILMESTTTTLGRPDKYTSDGILKGTNIEAGKNYTYNITVTKKELLIDASNITDWIPGNESNEEVEAVLQ